MSGKHRLITVLLLLSASLLVAPVASYGQSVWGTCSVEDEGIPSSSGTWTYRLEISWDTSGMGGHGMSHISFLLELGVCDCACEVNLIAFADTAGTGVGEGGCELLYYGLYECTGDPSFPGSGPTIKYEHYEGDCEPGQTGSATLYFSSIFGPGDSSTHVDALGIKAGTAADKGDLIGVLPYCQCASPVDATTWGVIKAVYR